jgi:hypothetical protein
VPLRYPVELIFVILPLILTWAGVVGAFRSFIGHSFTFNLN